MSHDTPRTPQTDSGAGGGTGEEAGGRVGAGAVGYGEQSPLVLVRIIGRLGGLRELIPR